MDDTRTALVKGLKSCPKFIPSWYRYDAEGSRLNDLCLEQCEEYYFHRFEIKLLKDIIENDRLCMDDFKVLVDLGSGNAYKTRFFLDKMITNGKTVIYIPVDISAEYLDQTADDIRQEYGDKLVVEPIAKDYVAAMEEISVRFPENSKLILWFGGFLNIRKTETEFYMSKIGSFMGRNDRLMISIDATDTCQKEAIEAAYLDPKGYGKALHLNSIRRLNTEYNADVDESLFDIKNELIIKPSPEDCSYVNVWIEAKNDCVFNIEQLGLTLKFAKGDKLFLHDQGGMSIKYSMKQIQHKVDKALLILDDCWNNEHVAVVVLRTKA